jgi:SNF2 family DNA or RNA helicase
MINGSVPINERQSMIDAFSNAVGSRVLVLNPRAAGTGLNIVAANHVIHYTLEWNPAVEDQASARAFRRGQRLPVTVHRLFYVDTVEDVINQRLERKRLLAESAVVGTDGVSVETTDIMLALAKTPSKASHAKMY